MSIDDYIEAFKKSVNNKKFLAHEWKFDIDNHDLFVDAVYIAYLDAARTFKGIGNKKDIPLVNLADKIRSYFKEGSAEDFDIWHKECFCKKFIVELRNNGYIASYGQAQKVVNMAFKYLYCCDGVNRDKFKNCHMALDTFTLNWFVRVVCEEKNIYNVGMWSKIDEDTYPKIQIKIRDYLKEKFAIEEEFIIWPDEILIAAALEFNSTLKKIKDYNYPKHNNESLAEVINETKKLLSDETTSKNF